MKKILLTVLFLLFLVQSSFSLTCSQSAFSVVQVGQSYLLGDPKVAPLQFGTGFTVETGTSSLYYLCFFWPDGWSNAGYVSPGQTYYIYFATQLNQDICSNIYVAPIAISCDSLCTNYTALTFFHLPYNISDYYPNRCKFSPLGFHEAAETNNKYIGHWQAKKTSWSYHGFGGYEDPPVDKKTGKHLGWGKGKGKGKGLEKHP